MISQIHLQNFKSFLDFRADLSQFTLIGGKNNTGKTNLLESLFFFHDMLNHEVTIRLLAYRGINEVEISPEAFCAPYFAMFNLSNPIKIAVSSDKGREELTVSYDSLDRVTPLNQASNVIKITEANQQSFGLSMNYIINKHKYTYRILVSPNGIEMRDGQKVRPKLRLAVIYPSRFRFDSTDDAVRFGKLDLYGEKEELLSNLRLFDPRIRDISTIAIGPKSILHVDLGFGRKLPIYLLGDGFTRVTSILLGMSFAKNGLVLIDEIENGLHHSVLDKIWSTISKAGLKYNCQVIATTHSYEALKSASRVFSISDTDFSYLRLVATEKGSIVKSFKKSDLVSSIEQDLELR